MCSAKLGLSSIFGLSLAALLAVCWADTLVQLHVNRPFNDVNENFVSFAVNPEDLYDALDGSHRKAVTSMAAMLGDSYVKFTGDYYFASNAPKRLRNPTKIIWKGFNRWTRAVNWTMIIPVPYAPDEWDSMHTLKILNTSYMVGISNCIWQLGTDFGTARAKDYVQELSTLKLMTDTFKPYVDDWRVMGADISAGSSAEETRRYVDMSKDLNAAFGWTQPPNMLPASSLGSYIYEGDPALRTLQQQRVPLWLTLPLESSPSHQQAISKRLLGDETTDALRWAQTLGDAASSGFDVIFKRMSLEDFERPNYSFYVTALFKKVMGSRVFPARPLNAFAPTNKLYTHCANAVSGGLAFMVVNTEQQPTSITVRSLSRLASSEVWQYILTRVDGRVLLNNVKLSLNSTLRPLIKSKETSKLLQLVTPSMSVGFWVLPSVNLEHCQFTEVEADEVSLEDSAEAARNSGYSSADRLLQKLIEETSVSRGALQSSLNRHRRFVLDSPGQSSLLGQLLNPFQRAAVTAAPVAKKRQVVAKTATQSVRPLEAVSWLRQVTKQLTQPGILHRRARSAGYGGPFFFNKHGKKTGLTKKITEIRKPERKSQPLFVEFDEEEFFKKLGDQTEPPAYSRLPEGDVHLKNIESVDGEETEQEESEPKVYKKRTVHSKKQLRIVDRSREEDNERRRSRLLPTEFFETLPTPPKFGQRLGLGLKLNSLLFPEPFSRKATIGQAKRKLETTTEAEPDVEPVAGGKERQKGDNGAEDFATAQRELGKHFLSHINEHEHEFALGDERQHESELEAEELKPSKQRHSLLDDYLGTEAERQSVPKKQPLKKKSSEEGITSWWDLPALRHKRALPMIYSNAIDKDNELLPLGNVGPRNYPIYEYKVDLPTIKPEQQVEKETRVMQIAKTRGSQKLTLSEKIVTTVKTKVSKFMNIISQHMNEWYNTLTRHLDGGVEQRRTNDLLDNAILK